MNSTKKILVAEDEEALRNIIADSLTIRGFDITQAGNGTVAYNLMQQDNFDAAVLDVMLPGMDGFSIVKELRSKTNMVPVLFLTSKTLPGDVVKGFESGGNDYLKKPFAMEELVIRIQSLLSPGRIIGALQTQSVYIGQYFYHPIKQQLIRGTEVIVLTARENEVLNLLAQQKHTVITKEQLLTQIWGDNNFFNGRTLDVFITRLRKYLKADPNVQIINIRGVGFKLVW